MPSRSLNPRNTIWNCNPGNVIKRPPQQFAAISDLSKRAVVDTARV
jgi:hypothetical protein